MADISWGASWLFGGALLAHAGKQFVELLQLLRQSGRGALQCFLKRLLGRIDFVESQQRLPALVLKGHGRDRALFALVVSPNDTRVWHHLEILAVEGHGVRTAGTELQPILAAGTNVHIA